MAKRMQFSVVGLPHYTIWHLYEPSVDDLRHMEEMEVERQQREKEENAKKMEEERQKKIKDVFQDPKEEWEKDDAAVKELAGQKEQQDQKLAGEGGGEGGPAAAKEAKDAIPKNLKQDDSQ